MATFKVKVSYGSGKPTKGSKVTLSFHGAGRGVTKSILTDSNGYAIFTNQDPGRADVIVDGSTRTTEYMSDGTVVQVKI